MKLSPAEIEDFRTQLFASAWTTAPKHDGAARRDSESRFPALTEEYIVAIEDRCVGPAPFSAVGDPPSAAGRCGFGPACGQAFRDFRHYARQRIFS